MMDDEDINFEDFKMGDISCAKCGDYLGCIDGDTMQINILCPSCVDEVEQAYKKEHPEEYE